MITLKTPEEIEIIKEGGKILAKVLKELEKMAKPGITTLELDRAAEALILSKGGKPAFKGYEGFPFSLCASVNENIVHGFPSKYVLKEGDVLKLDLGVLYNGYNTDMAMTVAELKEYAKLLPGSNYVTEDDMEKYNILCPVQENSNLELKSC